MAVTLTINVSNAEAVRVAAAFGKAMGLVDANKDPRPATMAEIKQRIIDQVKGEVLAVERDDAAKAAADLVTPIAPT